MIVFTALIKSILTQDLFLAFFLQTVLLLFTPELIILIRRYEKKSLLFTILSLIPVTAILAVLIFLPIKVGPTVTFDFSSLFLMLILAFSGNIVSVFTFIISLGFAVIKYGGDVWLRLIPYIVSSLLVLFGQMLLGKSGFVKKRYYLYVLFEVLVISIAVLLTSALKEATTPVMITSGIILFLIVPLFTLLIILVFNKNRKFLLKHQVVINKEMLQRLLLTSAYNIQIIAVDLDFNYLSFNEHHERVLADLYKAKAVVGLNFLTLISDSVDRLRIENCLSRAFQGEIFEVEIEPGIRKGLSFQESYAPIKGPNGEIIGATIFISELSERVERENRIKYLSYHDQGTGLYNRRYFDDYARNLKDYKGPVSVVYADINGLKITNDLFGHDAGDELLIAVTKKLETEFPSEMIARIGGDEIVVILRSGEVKELEKKIKQIQKELQATVISHLIVSVSFGVALAKSGVLVSKAIQEAEDRMYRDKLSSVNAQHKDVVDVLLKKINHDYQLEELNEEILDLVVKMGRVLTLSNGSLELLKGVVALQLTSCIYTPDRCPYLGRQPNFEESTILRKRLTVINRLILTSELYNPVSFDLVSIFENYNGSGAPRGLHGDEIPLKARIVRVVIDYVNLKWRDKVGPAEVLTRLEEQVGELYDPLIFETLKNLVTASAVN